MAHDSIDFVREFRRLGVEAEAPGVLSGDAASAAAFFRWLRSLPTGLGDAEFARRRALPPEAGGPGIARMDASLAPADPDHVDAELDESRAFHAELKRVVWPALRRQFPGGIHGFDLPHGEAAALANLRRLPDDAPYEAVMAALAAPAPGA